ncbi:hypothetical protein BC343_17580 [Mucilaginibacter pedocola]|uniref:Uncharacterized protein n=1 Tax=Mucilaginibacter pedocola TaxID=1792845 RepID=A0A1S9P7I0_9SPHI|nr:hypothetical protein BC343_17580 [Mucilaginibacter pedocola]
MLIALIIGYLLRRRKQYILAKATVNNGGFEHRDIGIMVDNSRKLLYTSTIENKKRHTERRASFA